MPINPYHNKVIVKASICFILIFISIKSIAQHEIVFCGERIPVDDKSVYGARAILFTGNPPATRF